MKELTDIVATVGVLKQQVDAAIEAICSPLDSVLEPVKYYIWDTERRQFYPPATDIVTGSVTTLDTAMEFDNHASALQHLKETDGHVTTTPHGEVKVTRYKILKIYIVRRTE